MDTTVESQRNALSEMLDFAGVRSGARGSRDLDGSDEERPKKVKTEKKSKGDTKARGMCMVDHACTIATLLCTLNP